MKISTVTAGALLALLTPAVAAAPARAPAALREDPKQALTELEKVLQREHVALRDALRAAEDDEARAAIHRDFRAGVLADFAERYAGIARAHPGTEVAREAWTKVVGLASQGLAGELPRAALDALTSDHIAAPELANVAGSLRYVGPALPEEDVVAALRTIAERSTHRHVQAAALLALGGVLGEGRPAGDPRIAEAKAVLAELSAYDDVAHGGKMSYADAGRAALFELENLLVGMEAPDFEAVDAEGAAFRLSDYEGKVVLLDFWGFW